MPQLQSSSTIKRPRDSRRLPRQLYYPPLPRTPRVRSPPTPSIQRISPNTRAETLLRLLPDVLNNTWCTDAIGCDCEHSLHEAGHHGHAAADD